MGNIALSGDGSTALHGHGLSTNLGSVNLISGTFYAAYNKGVGAVAGGNANVVLWQETGAICISDDNGNNGAGAETGAFMAIDGPPSPTIRTRVSSHGWAVRSSQRTSRIPATGP